MLSLKAGLAAVVAVASLSRALSDHEDKLEPSDEVPHCAVAFNQSFKSLFIDPGPMTGLAKGVIGSA